MKNLITQKIIAFQQDGSGEKKIHGILEHSNNEIEISTFSIEKDLPPILDETDQYLPKDLNCDLVLNFLHHQDLSHDLITLCKKLQIPIVSSGQKHNLGWGHTPPICCGLHHSDTLGNYGKRFGYPEFEVKLQQDHISEITITRGSSCGATWQAAAKLIGLPADQAIQRIGLEIQFFCHANPAGWDPIHGKSPLHFAGKIHSKALELAVEKQR